MKFSVQVIVHPDDDGKGAGVVREVFALDRDALAPDTLGLRLAEAQDLLVGDHRVLHRGQVQSAVAAQTACPECGRPRRHKNTRTIVEQSGRPAAQPHPPPPATSRHRTKIHYKRASSGRAARICFGNSATPRRAVALGCTAT